MPSAAALILATLSQGSMALNFTGGSFEVKSGSSTIQVSTLDYQAPAIFPADMLTLAYSGREITLDKKGLGIPVNGKMGYSRLPDIAMTTRLFSNKEIAETKAKIADGTREAGFSAISGYEYLGTTLYLLLRWDEKDGKPWLEALVAADLSKETIQPRLLGRFSGFSQASGVVDDRLESLAGDLVALINTQQGWGMASWSMALSKPNFTLLGPTATTSRFLSGGSRALGLSTTGYQTTLVTLANLTTETSRQAAEIRGTIRGFTEPHFLRWLSGTQTVITNLDSGAELRPGWDPAAVWTRFGLLVWWPTLDPKGAGIYEPSTFRPLASWKSPDADAKPVSSEP